MELLPVFVRKEPTVDTVAISHGLRGKQDTVYYRDETCTQKVARLPWHFSGHPTKRTRSVMLNCFRYAVRWVH